MTKISTPHGSNGGDVSPAEQNLTASMRVGMKKILMAALSRTDQINRPEDLIALVAEINSDVGILHQKLPRSKSDQS